MGPATPGTDSKPKEGGIPDIMRGIGNMLRIAILEYNYKASQNELKKVVKEINGLKSGNDNLQANVDRLTQELQNAQHGCTNNFHAWQNVFGQLQNANSAITQLQQHLHDFQGINMQLVQQLQGAQDYIADLTRENEHLKNAFTPLQQQLGLAQQQNHEQQNQLHQLEQQLQLAQDETATAKRQAQAAAEAAQADVAAAQAAAAAAQQQVAAAQQEATTARAAAEARVIAVERAQQQAQAHVAELKDQLTNTETLTEVQIQSLKSQLETAQQDARAAADEAQRARAAEAAARAASETAQQRVIEKEAEVEQERLRMAENAEAARTEANRERDEAVAAARAQIANEQRQAHLATDLATKSAAEVSDLQKQLTQQGLSQQEVATLNQQLEEAVRNANIEKADVEAANAALQRQLEEQVQEAQVAADAAETDKQELTRQLAALQGQVDTSGIENAGLQAQIAAVEKQLAEANDDAKQRQQEADEANQQLQTELQRVQEAAAAQAEAAQRIVQELETQLKQAKENGNTTADQRAALEKQLHQQQEAAEEARRAQQDALERAEEAERASEDTKKQITQQKVANTFMSALKTKANTAADDARKQLAEQQAAVETARKEAQEATQRAEDARKEAAARATQQQSELAAIQQELQTAKRDGEEVGSLKQQLEVQKLAAEKAEAARAEAAQQVEAAEAAKNAAEAAKTESANVLNESNDENNKLKSELDELKKKLAELTAAKETEKQLQQDTDRTEKQQKFTADKAALQASIAGAISKIEKMTDAKCKDQLLTTARQIEIEVNDLTLQTFTGDLDKKVQDLSEATGDKIKTFVSMRKEVKEPVPAGQPPQQDNPYNITFDKKKNTVTIPAIAGGGETTKVWGPFSGVFDPESTNEDKYKEMNKQFSGVFDTESTNEDKYKEMRAGLLDDIPSKETTVVIFGYGYSGSGKTHTLLGGYKDKAKTKWEDGIAQLAIQGYIDAGCTVHMEEVFEMYNDSYTFDNRYQKFVYNQSTSHKHTFKPVKLENINTFKTKYSEIQRDRIKQSHILPTPNNRESSRGHLFIVLKVTKDGKEGRLIICDMGGRENPNEMWMTAQYYKGLKPGNTVNVILGPVSKTNSSKYYKYTEQSPTESTEVTIPKGSTIVSAAKAVISDNVDDNTSLKFGITSVGREPIIRKTLKQGFYINDSINEMLAEFGYDFKSKGKQAESNWSGDTYNPDVRALSVAGKIGIRELFQEFREKSSCKIKFCTFACIRSPAVFFEDSIKTLQFAEAVNSVILAADSAPSSLPAAPAAAPAADAHSVSRIDPSSLRAAGVSSGTDPHSSHLTGTGAIVKSGGSIRRQRRKKHAKFKTFKKSRLGFLASDSALASDSNSVKVKHKTRNKKKHNTRNNTVKK